jgi:hypothetical protein
VFDHGEITVTNGSFSVPLGGETGLAPGTYTLVVSMILPLSQPPEVIALIGENGEHIAGEPSTAPLLISIEDAAAH